MSSVLRSVKKRTKSRRLGEVKIISREDYVEFDLDAKVEAIRALVPLGLMHVQETLDQEVTGAGWSALRPQGHGDPRAPARQQPRHGRAGWSARADPGAAGAQRRGE